MLGKKKEFVRLFLGRIIGLKKTLRLCLTLTTSRSPTCFVILSQMCLAQFNLLSHIRFSNTCEMDFLYFSVLNFTAVRFASFLSDGFITSILVNPPERKQAKHIYVYCCKIPLIIKL